MATTRRLSRRLLSVVLVVAVLAVGVTIFGMLAALAPPPVVSPPPVRRYNVEVFDIAPAKLQELIPSFGTARADREVVVSAQVAGTVTEMLEDLRVGRTVAPPQPQASPATADKADGDLLVEIDRQVFEQQLSQIEGRLREAQAEVSRLAQEQKNADRLLKVLQADANTAEEEYTRIKGLRERGVATPSDVTRALLDFRKYEDALVRQQNESSLAPLRVSSAKERLQTLQSDLAIAKKNLGDTRVYPPFAGTLAEVMIDEGQYVRVGDPLVRLTDTSMVEVPLPVKLSDFRKIQQLLESGVEPAVALAPDMQGEAKWTGKIVRVAPEADVRSRTIDVFVRVDNNLQPKPLLPGTFVHARIDGPILNDAIAIPREALLGGRLMVAVSRMAVDTKPESESTEESPASPFEVAVIELNPADVRTLQTIVLLETSVFASLLPEDRQPVQVILTNLDVLTAGVPIDIQSHTGLQAYLKQLGLPVIRQLDESKPGLPIPEVP